MMNNMNQNSEQNTSDKKSTRTPKRDEKSSGPKPNFRKPGNDLRGGQGFEARFEGAGQPIETEQRSF